METTAALVEGRHVRLLREDGRAVGMFTLTTGRRAEDPPDCRTPTAPPV
ncbi:hypothetical protein OIM90_22380 [Streptomyces sp. AD16]|nr:hypothetical protein NQP46_09960 [Streptomyces albus]WDV33057.1 hypothetical protein OIM90_22380 [Streptomyces sp. AD16]